MGQQTHRAINLLGVTGIKWPHGNYVVSISDNTGSLQSPEHTSAHGNYVSTDAHCFLCREALTATEPSSPWKSPSLPMSA